MKRKRGLVALAVSALLLGVAVAVAQGKKPTAPAKLTICHKTGSGTFKRITVSSRSVKSGLGATVKKALGHTGDAVVVGNAACPSPSLTPAANNTPPQKVTICHKTGSKKNPYVRITVSSRAVTNPKSHSGNALRGHMRHEGDILMPGNVACPSGSNVGQTKGLKLTADLGPVAGATGSGSATFAIRVGKGQLCFTLNVTGLTDVTAAHIHRVSTGAIVVPLTAPISGSSSGCVNVAKSLLQEIVSSPGSFFVNVHTLTFQNGQIRGNLSA
jgi:CHRD domain